MIYCVEDDSSIRDLMVYALRAAGFSTVGCADGEEFWQAMHRETPELVILDIMLPGLDGYALLECLRPQGVPVIFITAKSAVKDRVQGLRLGADDYITKPFAAEELVARMETVLRRTGRGGRELCAYDVVLDTVNHTARQNGEPVELRRLEYDLLELLMRNRGAALYRDVMYERVWGGIPDTESLRTVDTHIARLRKKLGWMDKIETVYKIGYRLKKED